MRTTAQRYRVRNDIDAGCLKARRELARITADPRTQIEPGSRVEADAYGFRLQTGVNDFARSLT